MKKIIFLCMVSVLLVCLIHWPTKLTKSYDCIEFIIGSDEFEYVTVEFDGIFYQSILRDDYVRYKLKLNDKTCPDTDEYKHIFPRNFRGLVSKNGEAAFDPTDKIETSTHRVSKYIEMEVGFDYWKRNNSLNTKLGTLYMSDDSSKVFISLYEREGNGYRWGGKAGYRILVSADNIASAVEVVDELTVWNLDHW